MNRSNGGKRPALPDTLSPSWRRELARRGHQLRAHMKMGRQGLTDAFAAQVSETMRHCDLFKIRIDAESGQEASQLAHDLSAKIGARVVQRIGRVALLYRPISGEDNSE